MEQKLEIRFNDIWRHLGLHIGYANEKDKKIKQWIDSNFISIEEVGEILRELEELQKRMPLITGNVNAGYTRALSDIRNRLKEKGNDKD